MHVLGWKLCKGAHLPAACPRMRPPHIMIAGLWDAKPVQCASGDYLVGDYAGWKAWRDQLPTVERV